MAKSFSNQENFYKRLRELSDVDAPSKSVGLDKQSLIEYTRANDGSALGIVKEDSSFYIKSSNSKGDIAVEHFTYIGGLENKLKYKYDTLSEAVKIKNFYVGALNESLERKFNPAKTLNEQNELVAKTNADKGGNATLQNVADKAPKGETLKDTAKESQVAEPVNKEGIANGQTIADKKKSDDASQKLKVEHEPSTASGAVRGDIAKIQSLADKTTKGETLKDTAKETQVAEPANTNNGIAKAQTIADTNKSEDKGSGIKVDGHKEVKPASDAKKEKAIVAENFGEEEAEVAPEEPGAGPSADVTGGGEQFPTNGGDEKADLDAAASALDALDIKADASPEVGGSPIGGGTPSAEVPSGNIPDAGAEAGGDVNVDNGDGSGDTGSVKDIEKLVGKTGQKIRGTDLTDEMVGGFLKSLISSFEGKLANLDSDLKRELANKILKAGEEGEESNGVAGSTTPDAAQQSSTPTPDVSSAEPEANANPEDEVIPQDKEIEEAINQHLAEMGIPDQGGTGAAPVDANPNSFKNYMAERGYNDEGMNEVSIMEMVSLVNGYANECGDNYANADLQTIAEYLSPEVKKGVTESGHGRFVESTNVFTVKPKKYKSMEPILEIHEETEEDKKVDETKDKFNFAAPAQSLNKAEKEEKKEEKKEDKKEEVSESAKSKLRSIINVKIQEQLGLRKKSINEGSKSMFSKKLDEMIAAEIEKGKIALKAKRQSKSKL